MSFPTTRKSLLVQIRSDNSAEATEALGALCNIYWFPIYNWLRAAGNSPEDSEELTQGFFVRAFEKEIFQKADLSKKLRSFLLLCLKQLLADENERANAQKRAGRKLEISLNHIRSEIGEAGLEHDVVAPHASPDQIYDTAARERFCRAAWDDCAPRRRKKGAARCLPR